MTTMVSKLNSGDYSQLSQDELEAYVDATVKSDGVATQLKGHYYKILRHTLCTTSDLNAMLAVHDDMYEGLKKGYESLGFKGAELNKQLNFARSAKSTLSQMWDHGLVVTEHLSKSDCAKQLRENKKRLNTSQTKGARWLDMKHKGSNYIDDLQALINEVGFDESVYNTIKDNFLTYFGAN